MTQILTSSSKKVRPLSDRVLVRVNKSEAVSKGGIHIPDTAKEKPRRGEVLAVGPGKRKDDGVLVPCQVKPGDVVLFTQWAGSEVKDMGDDTLIMAESDILAVIE